MSLPTTETLSEADFQKVRAYQRGTRNAGLVACLVGVLVMIAGRYLAGAPAWLVSVGVAIIVFGWGLFAYAFVRRLAMAKAFSARSSA